ncbi:hypothetical protein CNEO_460008 [Clostridium neonatale]|nr:hypothetical protein CNEO_460008 [Clostridium neonatale]
MMNLMFLFGKIIKIKTEKIMATIYEAHLIMKL